MEAEGKGIKGIKGIERKRRERIKVEFIGFHSVIKTIEVEGRIRNE